tara:strand:+ start:64499 stop:65977 length:1479 start_codon:yes stop_codon:yes gene_type:complete
MKFFSSTKSAVDIVDDALFFPLFEDDSGSKELAIIDKKLNNVLLSILKAKDFKGELGETFLLNTNNLLPAKRLFLLGLGKQKEFSEERFRKAVGSAAKRAKNLSILNFSLCTHHISLEPYVLGKVVAEAVVLSNYTFDTYKTKDKKKSLESITLCHDSDDAKVKQGLHDAEIISSSSNLTRELINTPAADMTPAILAQKAKDACKKSGVKCTIFDEKQIKKLNMNALLAVGSGSANPPRFIVMEHKGKKAKETIVLIGKGVTFDSGGINIKPGSFMKDMKYDMSGSAAVIGTMQAIAQLQLPLHVVGLVATAENMPGNNAYRPGDVIKALNGKTIEVLHTDAEGRVTLTDSLCYAEKFKPSVVIDLATLTGAVTIALGNVCAAVMGNDDALIKKLQVAGDSTFERVWQLPLYEEFAELNKGAVGDVANIGGWDGKAGSIVAGMFLKEFVPSNAKWMHLDIANKAFSDKDTAYLAKGATGFGVRLLVELLQKW